MGWKERYEKNKQLLLTDKKICKPNLELFKEFFEFEEKKLKRINDNAKLDESSYKTLFGYINKFRNVNEWFKNKAWKDLTHEEIQQVYEDLEDGKIKNKLGKRFADRRGYYNKVFKAKPFEMAGKKEIVEQALEFFTDRRSKEINFVNEENFKKIVSVLKDPRHLALAWLSWDVGENINTLLELTAANFQKQENKEAREKEYKIWLPQGQLKRSRQQRSELTLFPDTVKYLDIVLKDLKPEDKVFNFGYRQALSFFSAAVKRSGATCEPTGKAPTWKDLRSGMACNLFKNYGWTGDDINLRLGHSISSRELDSYFSYLAARGKKAKKLHYKLNLEEMQEEINELKQREKAYIKRIERVEAELENDWKARMDKIAVQKMEEMMLQGANKMKQRMREELAKRK